jgi:group I intron endonuclease
MYSGIIYCAISPSGKKYYGKTTRTLKTRKREHSKNIRHWIFTDALRKYGIDNFQWDVIESISSEDAKDLRNKLDEREKYWIERDKTQDRNFGYNMLSGGDGTFGYKRVFSEEHKRKISEALKGKKLPEEVKNEISRVLKGKNKSDIGRRNMSDARKGIKFSEDHCKNISKSKSGENNPNWGKYRSAETKRKISESNIGQKRTEETRENIGRSKRGVKLSAEHRNKISQYQKGLKRSADTREKLRISALNREAKRKNAKNEIENYRG